VLFLCTAQVAQSQIVAAPPNLPSAASVNGHGSSSRGARFVQGIAPALDLSGIAAGAARARMAPGDSLALQKPASASPLGGISISSISFGSVRAQIGGGGIPGHHHGANFRLEGVSIFGSSISGSVDGRSAHIALTWPASL
jgi:hypothetical protein